MKVNHNQIKIFISSATLTLLLACSHNPPAPVYDLSSTHQYQQTIYSSNNLNTFYIVKPGDTLFSIAWDNSVDVQDLIEINQVKNNLIYPGQKISLVETHKPAFFDSNSLLEALNKEVLNRDISQKNSTRIVSTSVNNKKIKSQTKPHSRQNKKNKNNVISNTKIQNTKVQPKSEEMLNWIWPTDGKILATFSSEVNANRGLDIEATHGDPVRATAPGRVVYEGSGLRGYGKLVIIKHSQNYLSAYAHNDRILVSENEIVKSGQRIADVGSSGTTQNSKLHFEIRYKGKPVDPLNYLPEKKI